MYSCATSKFTANSVRTQCCPMFTICNIIAVRKIPLYLGSLISSSHFLKDRDHSVGITTSYGLDGPGIESQCGEIFRTLPDPLWGPTSVLYNGYLVFPGFKRSGRGVDHSPPSSAEAK